MNGVFVGFLYLVKYLKTKGSRQKWLECATENLLNAIFASYNFHLVNIYWPQTLTGEVIQKLLLAYFSPEFHPCSPIMALTVTMQHSLDLDTRCRPGCLRTQSKPPESAFQL